MRKLTTKIVIPDYNTELDLYEDVALALTYSISEVRDITLRKSNYSKTFIIPGSEINNKLFNHIYNINTFDWTYDINTKTKAYIYSDDNLVFEGYLKLEKIIINKDNVNYDTEVQYEITFSSSIGGFFDIVKSKTLGDLDLSQYNHYLTVPEVLYAYENDYKKGYTYPLLKKSTPSNSNYWKLTDFKPAFYIKTILDKIFIEAGYGYESEFLNSDFFKHLIMLDDEKTTNKPDAINDNSIKITSTTDLSLDRSTKFDYFGYASTPSAEVNLNQLITYGFGKKLPFNVLYDKNNNYDITNNQIIGSGAQIEVAGDISFNITIEYTAGTINTSYGIIDSAYLYNSNSPEYNYFYIDFYLVEVLDGTYNIGGTDYFNYSTNGFPYFQVSRQIKAKTRKEYKNKLQTYYAQNQKVEINDTARIIFGNIFLEKDKRYEIHAVANLDTLQFYGMNSILGGERIIPGWYGPIPTVNNLMNMSVTIGNRAIKTTLDTSYYENNMVYMDSFVPNKVKQSEFLTSIVKLFNLYIDESKTKDKTFVIEPRNSYYSTLPYKIHNWSNKINLDTKEIILLPDLNNKQIKFEYAGLNTDFGEQYEEIVKDNYGDFDINIENEYLEGEESIKNIFQIPSVAYVVADNDEPDIFNNNNDVNPDV